MTAALDANLRRAVPDSDLVEQLLRARVRERLLGRPTPALTIGRYKLERPIGSGGMGVVFTAQDPKLSRRVAIKLLRCRGGDDDGARLKSEAKALAQLAHPNVVPVFDVGSWSDQIFFAMEYIPGLTAAQWLARDKPSVDVCLNSLAAAGEGIAAAHRVGIIHGDIKPSNILIGDDGRVRVTDFGLAQEADQFAASAAGSTSGTAPYMAPELFSGSQPSEASDQFAFCVTLFEGLYGLRPFVGDSTTQLAASMKEGRIQTVPTRRVPRGIRSLVLRGLSANPQDRFDSMPALLSQLRRVRHTRRWRVGFGAAVGGLLIAGGVGYTTGHTSESPAAVCNSAKTALDGVWGPKRRIALQAAFARTSVLHRNETSEVVVARLDQYASEWTSMRTESCEATWIDRSQSQSLLDRRVQCLDEQAQELDAMIDVFSLSPEEAIGKATDAVFKLPSVSRCQASEALENREALPKDPAGAAQAKRVASAANRGKALLAAGLFFEAKVELATVTEDADELSHSRTRARYLLVLAQVQQRTGAIEAAESTYRQAAQSGSEGNDDLLVAEVWVGLTYLLGLEQRDTNVDQLIENAELALLRAKTGGDELRVKLSSYRAGLLRSQGKYPEAIVQYEQAIEIAESHFGSEHATMGKLLSNFSNVLTNAGDYERAAKVLAQARLVIETSLGPNHPIMAVVIGNQGGNYHIRGEFEKAREMQGEALAVIEARLGQGHIESAWPLQQIGLAFHDEGDFKQATVYFEKAATVLEKQLGPEHLELARALNGWGLALAMSGRRDEGLKKLRRALTIRLAGLPVNHPEVAQSHVYLAQVLIEEGALDDAMKRYRIALASFEEALGSEHAHVGLVLAGIAEVRQRKGDQSGAAEAFQRAIQILVKAYGEGHPKVAEVRAQANSLVPAP